MKNVNLTQLYLGLVDHCDISGFTLNTVKKQGSKEPTDAMFLFYPRKINDVDLDKVGQIVKDCITGDVKSIDIKMNIDELQVYIEFLGFDDGHWDKGL